MKTSEFDYFLPKELIAQTPVEPRDSSRLLVLNKRNGAVEHRRFHDVLDYLESEDCLVLNDTKVIPARIFGNIVEKKSKVEFLLLKQVGDDIWEVLAKPGKKAKIGTRFEFKENCLYGEVLDILPNGGRLLKFFFDGSFYDILDKIGAMPVPHYIKSRLENKERYQTVYAKVLGSAAAPTAGLHFTNELINQIKMKGVKIVYITLHVGLGTFRPVQANNVKDHKMHSEWYTISPESAREINLAKKEGKRVICVGTTSCRTLESVYKKHSKIVSTSGETDIFIYPGFKFKVMDALITNFHLPKSTLIMLVCAFAGKENTLHAYEAAVNNRYRFFSFGDAMLIF